MAAPSPFMRETNLELTETHVLGRRTKQVGVRVDLQDQRAWLADFPVCALLHQQPPR